MLRIAVAALFLIGSALSLWAADQSLSERSYAQARAVLDRAVEANGGAEALRAIKAVRLNLEGATFARLAGIDLLHVPYKSSPPALTDVIAGRVSMMFIDVLTGLPHVKAKALKVLAVTTKQKSALLPELPTMDETVKGFDITSWQGYFGPANLPNDIVTKLNAEIRKIVERPEIKEQLAERGMEAFSSTPEEFEKFLKDQLVLWEKLITDAGIEKQ